MGGGVQQEVGDFITARKIAEDSDDRKLAFDSLQVGYSVLSLFAMYTKIVQEVDKFL